MFICECRTPIFVFVDALTLNTINNKISAVMAKITAANFRSICKRKSIGIGTAPYPKHLFRQNDTLLVVSMHITMSKEPIVNVTGLKNSISMTVHIDRLS